jgi:hypothetical protein
MQQPFVHQYFTFRLSFFHPLSATILTTKSLAFRFILCLIVLCLVVIRDINPLIFSLSYSLFSILLCFTHAPENSFP